MEIQLKENEPKYISKNTVVDSGGLGPCTAVFLYNKDTQEVIAGHFEDCEENGLESMIKGALRMFNIKDLGVFIAGNSAFPDKDGEG